MALTLSLDVTPDHQSGLAKMQVSMTISGTVNQAKLRWAKAPNSHPPAADPIV